MGVAGVRWGVATWEHTALVALIQRGADGGGDKALLPADVEYLGRPAQHDGQDVGVAEQAA